MLAAGPLVSGAIPQGGGQLNVPAMSAEVSSSFGMHACTFWMYACTSYMQKTDVPAEPSPFHAVQPPPSTSLPPLPKGFVAPSKRDFVGYRPSERELSAATSAVADLGSFTSYRDVLGAAAPDPDALAKTLELALQWRAIREQTAAWEAYVQAQDAIAWKAALLELDRLKPFFLRAAATTTLGERYPGLMELLYAPKRSAKQAAVTRKRRAAEKASKDE